MAIVNQAKREINAKIVYFGPEGAGKTTAMRYAYDRIKPSLRGDLKIVPASGSELVFFDFSPFEQTLSGGYRLRLHIYTLHGNSINPAAWKMTLKGADGLLIMGDASPGMLTATQQSILQLKDLFGGYGIALDELPSVLQMNKSDLCDNIATSRMDQLAASLGVAGISGSFSSAQTGQGVLEALTRLSRQVIERISLREDLKPVYEFSDEPVGKPATEAGAETEKAPDRALPETDLCESKITIAGENLPTPTDDIRITVAGTDVRYEDGCVKIPLQIVTGQASRTVMITVSADLLG